MKKVLLPLLIILSISLTACLSMPDVLSLDDVLEDKVSESLGLDELALEIQAIQFYSLYYSYAFYGGYNYEEGYDEGQGLRWAFTTIPADSEPNTVEYERVLLKGVSEGAWWRLSVENEETRFEYEYLIDDNSDFLVIRFRDEDSGEIVEYIPSQDAEADIENSDDEDYEGFEDFSDYEYKQYSMGNEKVTVGAGSFTAEHMVSEVKGDSDSSVDFRADSWLVDSVPGGIVKYLWTDNRKGDKMESELVEILNNQKSTLGSF